LLILLNISIYLLGFHKFDKLIVNDELAGKEFFQLILLNMKNALRFSAAFSLLISLTWQTASSQQNDEILFYKHIAVSAMNGVYYGMAADHIFSIEDYKAAVAIPIITAGTLALVPLFTNETRTITSNQLLLSGHGQLIGWAHGLSLALLINGENSFDEGKSKLTVGMAALGSIGMGIAGKSLATKKDWSEGRVALYRHYGLLMPTTGAAFSLAVSDDIRVFASSVLLFGAGSYFLADRVNRWHEFTRGEIRATQALTLLNGGLGLCILADIEPGYPPNAAWLLPGIGLLSGTGLGHLWLKDLNLTPQQGMTTMYAAGLGSLIGIGLAILFNPEDADFNASHYLLPYSTGMATYSYAVWRLKNKNAALGYVPHDNSTGKWDFSFMPQNLYLNEKLGEKGNIVNNRLVGMQPVFSATCTF
jgi:hypothetical protein